MRTLSSVITIFSDESFYILSELSVDFGLLQSQGAMESINTLYQIYDIDEETNFSTNNRVNTCVDIDTLRMVLNQFKSHREAIRQLQQWGIQYQHFPYN